MYCQVASDCTWKMVCFKYGTNVLLKAKHIGCQFLFLWNYAIHLHVK